MAYPNADILIYWPTWEVYPLAGADANGWVTATVSTEQPLVALTDFGTSYRDVAFELDNPSANLVRLYVDQSPNGTRIRPRREQLDVDAASADALTFLDVRALYWSAAAAGNPDAGNPSSQVRLRALVRKPQRR